MLGNMVHMGLVATLVLYSAFVGLGASDHMVVTGDGGSMMLVTMGGMHLLVLVVSWGMTCSLGMVTTYMVLGLMMMLLLTVEVGSVNN